MAEYISKETVLKKLQMQLLDLEANQDKGEYSELCENRGARDALDEAIYDIRTIKTADVQPVKRGKWELTNNPSFRKCSECGAWWSSDITDNCFANYCPKCGARMDGEQND